MTENDKPSPEMLRREPLIDTREAAERMGLVPQTVSTWRTKGFGPPHITMGRKVLYDPADIDAWIASNKHQSTKDRPA